MSDELFQLSNGRYIVSEEISKKMSYIKSVHPETPFQENSTPYPWDESGMAELFAECYQNDTRFCPEAKSWYTYDEGKWTKDVGSLLVAAKIKEFTRLMSLYCGEISDEETRRKYMQFVAKMGDRRFRDRLMKDAADSMRIEAERFDAHPYLINCKNGTFDLKHLQFREHHWDDFLTMQTAFDYGLREIRCDRWEQFVREVTEGNEEKADFLQRALGYSILGTSKEECMFILYGKTTRNGKSTLLSAIQHMLGDYATVAPVSLICTQYRNPEGSGAANPVLAGLKGKRFVTMAESEASGKLDESAIKQFTGGEAIKARELYQAPITFTPQFTLWLSCNDLPRISDRSLFASDRIKVIEFTRHFAESEQDKDLKDLFRTQDAMRGIFAWLVEGYFKYIRFGLTMSEDLRKVVKQYERDNDVVLQFLEDRCQMDPEASVKGSDLYVAYKIWAKSAGYPVRNQKSFYAAIQSHPDWCWQTVKPQNKLTFKGFKLV